jgi:hypothetical protein
MRKLLAAALLVMGLSAMAFGQQDEGRNAPARAGGQPMVTPGPDRDAQPYSRSMTGKVLKVSATDNLIIIDSPKTRTVEFALNKDVRTRADKNTDLADRKDISLADYKPGRLVKVTYRLSDYKVLEIRLKPTTR